MELYFSLPGIKDDLQKLKIEFLYVDHQHSHDYEASKDHDRDTHIKLCFLAIPSPSSGPL